MKVVIAPDKFKDCLTAADVARAIAAGLRRADPDVEIDACPMADGGEGTVDALVAATGGKTVVRRVTGPLPGMKVDAPIGLLGDGFTAAIEMASASGLHLLKPDQRDPLRTTTYGTGELLRAAAELGIKTVILGIGGSATVDGGIGAAQAWGARFVLKTGQTYSSGDRRLSGGDLKNLLRVEHAGEDRSRDPRAPLALPFSAAPQERAPGAPSTAPRTTGNGTRSRSPFLDTGGIEFVVACDVGNPLFGDDGAAPIFGPQKGATPEQVRELDEGLRQLAERTGMMPLADAPGAGAAGGLGFGMMAFFGATLRSGAQIVMDATRLRDRLVGADLCITGEGRLDAQSLGGKTAVSVARLCRELNVPCVALAGAVDDGADAALAEGVTSYFSICDRPMPVDDAIRDAARLLEDTSHRVLRLLRARPSA
jgi:glycerate kinase